jgi:hypothetical protein
MIAEVFMKIALYQWTAPVCLLLMIFNFAACGTRYMSESSFNAMLTDQRGSLSYLYSKEKYHYFIYGHVFKSDDILAVPRGVLALSSHRSHQEYIDNKQPVPPIVKHVNGLSRIVGWGDLTVAYKVIN